MSARVLWTRPRRSRLRKLCLEGRSDAEIADELGTSAEAIALQRCRQRATREGRRAIIEATTGQLMDALRARGYHVQITRSP